MLEMPSGQMKATAIKRIEFARLILNDSLFHLYDFSWLVHRSPVAEISRRCQRMWKKSGIACKIIARATRASIDALHLPNGKLAYNRNKSRHIIPAFTIKR